MNCCSLMEYYLKQEDKIVQYREHFDQYGITVPDGTEDTIKITYCPWCGCKLPESRRDEWFEELEQLGYDDPFSQDIPEKYKTSAWYREKKVEKG